MGSLHKRSLLGWAEIGTTFSHTEGLCADWLWLPTNP